MPSKKNRLAIRGGNVLLPGKNDTVPADLLIENGIITRVGPELRGDEEIDAAGHSVLPGFVDLHTHGLEYESSVGDLAAYARAEAAHGTTAFIPTLFGPPGESAETLHRHRRETDELKSVPQVAGFRLESPYLNYTGAGISRDLAPITPETTHMLLDAGRGHIKIWDISPELPGAPDLIEQVSALGIICSIAHTRATIEQLRTAVDAGARLVTHLFDTFEVPPMTDPGVYPAGAVDYLLVEDRVVCEIIGDGTHVHPLLVEKALRCKTTERIAFITDSNYGAGLAPGDYDLPFGWGRVRIGDPNRGIRLIDREMALAGSAIAPINLFRNAVRLFGLSFDAASTVCSRTPARLLGLNKGEIRPGLDGDVVVLDGDLRLHATIAKGKVVFRHEAEARQSQAGDGKSTQEESMKAKKGEKETERP